jgi:hypothetical protein
MKPLHYWADPISEEVAPTYIEFLHALRGPTHIFLPGRDSSRCRAVMTLMHGNEPSGLAATHALLRQGIEPAVDIHIFIASVEAARTEPLFYHRMLPGDRDLNRCFSPPFMDNPQGQLAKVLYEKLHQLQPEAMIDMHNTSGAGPAFGVVTFMDPRHESLVSLFSHRLVVTDLLLGSVMELSRTLCPTVTVECGGARDPESDRTALIGLSQFVSLEDVLNITPQDVAMEFFHHPLRLELLPGAAITYGPAPLSSAGITMLRDVERLNFNYVEPHTPIGFVTGELNSLLRARSASGENRLEHFFLVEDGQLKARVRMKFFMVTNNPEIARTDCLLYLVPAA